MNIIQTLWTSKKMLLNDSFGWLTPQHHLMGWELSSLKIREFYNELHLYTDSHGEDILISKLELPYTKVNNVYNKIETHASYWAIC